MPGRDAGYVRGVARECDHDIAGEPTLEAGLQTLRCSGRFVQKLADLDRVAARDRACQAAIPVGDFMRGMETGQPGGDLLVGGRPARIEQNDAAVLARAEELVQLR